MSDIFTWRYGVLKSFSVGVHYAVSTCGANASTENRSKSRKRFTLHGKLDRRTLYLLLTISCKNKASADDLSVEPASRFTFLEHRTSPQSPSDIQCFLKRILDSDFVRICGTWSMSASRMATFNRGPRGLCGCRTTIKSCRRNCMLHVHISTSNVSHQDFFGNVELGRALDPKCDIDTIPQYIASLFTSWRPPPTD